VTSSQDDTVSDASRLSHAEQTLRGLRHLGSAQIFTQLVTWGLTAVTIHLLQPRDYGLIATAGIITAFAQMLLDGGLSEVLISQQDLSELIQGAAVTAVLLVSLVVGGAIFAIAPFASSFFRSPPLRAILEVSAFYLPLAALQVAPGAQLYKQMKFRPIAVAQTASNVIQGVSTLGLAYAGAGYWALIAGVFIGTGLRVTLLWLSLEYRPRPNLRLRALRHLVRKGSHMIGMRFAYFFIDNFDLFLLSRFAGAAALGQYSVARNLSHSALDRIAGIVNQVSVPAFAAKTGTSEQLRGLLFVMSLASVVFFPLFWIMGAASQVALPLILGSRWTKLVIPFLAFTAILPLRGLFALLNASVIGTGRTGTVFWNTLSWATISTPFMILGVTRGADGVALSWLIAFPVVFYLAMRRTSRAFSAPVSTLLLPLAIPAACAAASALATECVLLGLSTLLPRPILVACQCGVGGICYWVLLRSFGPAHYSQALTTVRRLIRS
jgi:teichuronic acid exporter